MIDPHERCERRAMMCVQFGHRIRCPRGHVLDRAEHTASTFACHHVDRRSGAACVEHCYVHTVRPRLHLCIAISASQFDWLTTHRPDVPEALNVLGYLGWPVLNAGAAHSAPMPNASAVHGAMVVPHA